MSGVRNASSYQPVAGTTAGYATTTSAYTPATVTTSNLGNAYNATNQVYSTSQPGTTTEYYTVPGQTVTTGTAQYGATQYVQNGSSQYVQGATQIGGQKAVASDIPVESRIEYIPFEKKYTEYEQIEKVYQVPVETEVVEYEEVVRNERIPYERTITDYYAVETQVEYIRREVEETVMVEEPVERTFDRVQYIPVETQIVHYPERENYVPAKTQTRTEYVGVVDQGAVSSSAYQVQGGSRAGQTYVASGSGAGNTYVASGSGVGQTTYANVPVSGGQVASSSYQTYSSPATYTSTTGPATYTTTTNQAAYTSGPAATYTSNSYAPAQTTYQTATSGSGVRQSGYVTGGSGVRGSNVVNNTNTYVTGGSGVKGASYETSANYRI